MTRLTLHYNNQNPITLDIDPSDASIHVHLDTPSASSSAWQTVPSIPHAQSHSTPQKRRLAWPITLGTCALAAIMILGVRPALPGGSGLPHSSGPLLPPLPSGPISGTADPTTSPDDDDFQKPMSANARINAARQVLRQSPTLTYPSSSSTGSSAEMNQGGAPTAGVAPSASQAPVVGSPAPSSPNTRSPFGLEN